MDIEQQECSMLFLFYQHSFDSADTKKAELLSWI